MSYFYQCAYWSNDRKCAGEGLVDEKSWLSAGRIGGVSGNNEAEFVDTPDWRFRWELPENFGEDLDFGI